MKTREMTLSSIRRRGHKALFDALGPVGFIRFMQQFVSRGDYTADREKWIGRIDLSDLRARAAQATGRKKRKAG
jgi:hypothetical protein